MINHYALFQHAAIGRAIAACGNLENTLVKIYAVRNRSTPDAPIRNDDVGSFSEAINANQEKLLKFAWHKLGQFDLTDEERQFCNLFFKKQRHGEEHLFLFTRWRNTLCHGQYLLLPNSEIHFEFWDRSTISKANSDKLEGAEFRKNPIKHHSSIQELSQVASNFEYARNLLTEKFDLRRYGQGESTFP